ncbi:MAG TPA: DNA methyltransferase [Candidatus Limnocylindrales bacterium]|nr:DNA methyltransferase [Candidatus Limnocylindrales bacterium]
MPPAARTAPGQLGLFPELPRLDLAPEWKQQQRLWGHSFHPMCSYLAMFPAGLAHAFIARYSRPGDVVLDPFSGRGTTPLQACAEGRFGLGLDLNPFAHLLTAAKVEPPTRGQAEARLAHLRIDWSLEAPRWIELAAAGQAAPGPGGVSVPGPRGAEAAPLPVEVALCFHPRTLAQLLFVRSSLDLGQPTDRFLAAATAGILHGRSASYLSDVMPNSFSMAPRYVRDYVARRGFRATERDVFASLGAKLRRLYRQGLPAVPGMALLGDALQVAELADEALRRRAQPERARLVVTSPPYLRVVKYGYYNWLRLWFLGIDPAAVDRRLDDAHQLDAYLAFLRRVLAGLRDVLTDDAVVALVIGDVESDRGKRIEGGVGLAETVWERAAELEGYRLAGVVVDDIAAGRKLTRIWGREAGQATKTDRILVLAPTEAGRRRALAGAATPIDWSWPPPEARAFA